MKPENGRLYYSSLTLTNVKSFGGRQVLDLRGKNGGPAAWTLIVGENGSARPRCSSAWR